MAPGRLWPGPADFLETAAAVGVGGGAGRGGAVKSTSPMPTSGTMRPKPLSALNHFTVPCALCFHLLGRFFIFDSTSAAWCDRLLFDVKTWLSCPGPRGVSQALLK